MRCLSQLDWVALKGDACRLILGAEKYMGACMVRKYDTHEGRERKACFICLVCLDKLNRENVCLGEQAVNARLRKVAGA